MIWASTPRCQYMEEVTVTFTQALALAEHVHGTRFRVLVLSIVRIFDADGREGALKLSDDWLVGVYCRNCKGTAIIASPASVQEIRRHEYGLCVDDKNQEGCRGVQ